MNFFLRRLLTLLCLIGITHIGSTQIVSNNAFLKGNFVEVGIAQCGSYGSSVNAPAGYHPRGAGNSSGTNQLGFVSNPAKNNWTSYVGDYFLPGAPEEGWGMTINNVNYNNSLICSSPIGIQGGFLNYEQTSSQVSVMWQGFVNGLTITKKTYIPMNSLFFVTEVTIQNTSANTVNDIFYMRNVDPDHGVLTPGAGGSFNTLNTIVNQNPNSCNQALVSAVTLAGNHYLGLGSVDSRARVTTGGFSNRSAKDIWNGTGFLTSGSRQADQAVSVAFNIGNLLPNESTKFAYAYILDAAQLTQALAATNINLSLDGVNFSTGNTTNICSGTPIPITLSNTGTFTNWTWSPATFLNTTTGTSVTSTATTPITYTATGTGVCGTTSVEISLNPVVEPVPAAAGAISGLPVIGLGQTGVTFSTPQVANAKTYIWSLPPGAVITSPKADSNVITFNAPNTTWCGDVTVTPKNSCGSGTPSSLAVCISNIATGGVTSPLCGGTNTFVPFSTPLGFFLSGNVFTAQLSNASGSFANPTNIGSVTSTSSGFINATIPANTPAGNGYRIRVISSNPATLGTDNGSNITINPALTPSIQINANQTTLCGATVITFTATATNGGTTPIYQWRKNGNNVGTNSTTYTDNSLVPSDVISCVLTSNATCLTTPTATSNNITLTGVNGTPSIAITADRVTACNGQLVTFTATAINGGTSPIYQWTKNGNAVGTNSNTYTDNSLQSTDIINCTLTSNATCMTTNTATSNNISVVINPNLVPAVTVTSSVDSVCSGSPTLVTFTANVVNGGSNPLYQWRRNGININGATASTYATSTFAASDVFTCVITSNETCVTTNTATSAGKSIVIIPAVTPTIDITATQTVVCNATTLPTVTYTASITNGGSNPVYQWFRNGISVGTNSPTFSTNAYTNGTTITCKLTSSSTERCLTSDTAISNTITMQVTVNVTPFVTISGSSTACSGASVTYVATPFNGGTTPSFQWRKNGVNVGTNSSTYTDNTLQVGDVINCVLTSNAPCLNTNDVVSNSITITNILPAVTPALTISASQTTICTGSPSANIVFRANPVNGGTTPQFQWYKNNVLVATTIGLNYNSLGVVAGDRFFCVMTTNAVCATVPTVTSDTITITSAPTATPTISIASTTSTNICSSNNVVINATVTNAGVNPTYSWFRNATLISTTTLPTLNLLAGNLANGDVITCRVQSNLACASPTIVTSNALTFTVTATVTPTIVVTADQTTICAGTPVIFTAAITNGGTNPSYRWFKNGIQINGAAGSGSTYTDASLVNGDFVNCRLTNNTTTCVTSNNVFSNNVSITVTSGITPSVTISSNAGSEICSNTLVTFTATPFNGGTNPSYQWFRNTTPVGTNSATYSVSGLVSTDEVYCRLTVNTSTGCYLTNTALSNRIGFTIAPSVTPTINLTASQTVICTSTFPTITFTANVTNEGFGPQFIWRKNGNIVSTTTFNSYSTNIVVAGDVFTCELISNAACVTSNNIISNSVQISSATSATPSISIALSNAPTTICAGSNLTFVANTNNAGATPTLQWRKNGFIQITTTNRSFTYFNVQPGDNFSCTVISNVTCSPGTVTSAVVTPTINALLNPSISITASQTNVCAGTLITFNATAINAGTTPTYTWRKNGIIINGATERSYAADDFAMGDRITCTVGSNAVCRNIDTAISNGINLIVTGSIPTAVVSTNNGTLCPGANSATFTIVATNVGTTPTYQWKKNGLNVGSNSTTYTDNSLVANDTIYCLVTSSATCTVTKLSNKIIVRFASIATPTTNNPVTINCGNFATLNAVPSNPQNGIRWYNTSSGGTAIAYDTFYRFRPLTSTILYAEEFTYPSNNTVTSITTSATVRNSTSAGTHVSSMALTAAYVYQVAATNVIRYNKLNLDSARLLPTRTGFFGDLSTNTIWQIGNITSNGNSFSNGVITRLYKLDKNLVPTGEFINLSQSITLFNTTSNLICSGEGYVIIYEGNSFGAFYHVNLNTGDVTVLANSLFFTFGIGSNNTYASGWSEFDGVDYFVVCTEGNNIIKINTRTGVKSVLQSFTNINNVRSIAVDAVLGRVYFQHPNASQFSSFGNNIGFLAAAVNLGSSVCSSARQAVNITVNTTTPIVTASGSTTFCNGGSVTLATSGGTAYQWLRDGNNIASATNASFVATQSGNYSVIVTSANGCVGVSANTLVTVNPLITPAITITANQTTICAGTPITFTATPTNGGTNPNYQWRKNGNPVGSNSATYTDNGLVNGDVVTCTLTSTASCLTSTTANSNSITLTVNSAVPSVSVTATQTNICSGTLVTFTATAINGGTAPTYVWRKNGSIVGSNSATYTDNVLANGDQVTCTLTSNANCATTTPVTSNTVTMTVTNLVTPSITITTANTNVCANSSTTFTATITGGGTSPIYQWRRNGINVGSNSSTFTTNTLTNGDVVTCLLTSNLPCVTSAQVSSNSLTMTVNNIVTPSVTITASSNPICAATSVTYTATVVNGGNAPTYEWRRNNVVVGTNSTYTDNAPANGVPVNCTVTSSAPCTTTPTATSNTLVQTVIPTAIPTINITGTTTLCSGNNFTTLFATITNGGTSPIYTWYKNGIVVGANSAFYSDAFLNGDVVYCRLTSNANCATPTNVNSTNLTFTVNNSVTPTATISVNNNNFCGTGNLVLTVNTTNFGSSVLQYFWLRNGITVGTTSTPTFNYTETTSANFSCQVSVQSTTSCLTTSFAVTNTLSVNIIPLANISISSSTAVFCTGSNSATFTASISNAGISPAYQWRKNGNVVGSNSATYTDNALQNNDSIWCILTPNSTCNIPDTSNKVYVNFQTVTAPIVASPVSIVCGDSVTLAATIASGNNVRWFATPTATTPIVTGNNRKVLTTSNTIYYAEAFAGTTSTIVTSLGTTAVQTVDHNSLTGDDRGGIAVSTNFVYYSGDNFTGRFDKNNLSSSTSLLLRDGFFSDMATGNLWQLGDASTLGASFLGGTVDRLYRLTEDLTVTSQVITLSQPITLTSGISFVASGFGYVLLTSGGSVWYVDLSNGAVTTLNTTLSFSFAGSESWASYGWAENNGSDYFIVYAANPNIVKINVVTGITSILQTYGSISDMAAIAFDATTNRMYFHHEGSSSLGVGSEVLGYVNANTSTVNSAAASCISNRVPLVVNITPMPAPTISTTGSTTICSNATVTLTASAAASYQWQRNGVNISGATNQTFNANVSGNYTVTVTNTAGCSNVSTSTTVTVNNLVTPTISITANQTTICAGTPITFTATITNGGSNPIYQWRKNGNLVGSNNATYTDNTLVNGDAVTCTLVSNANCLASNNIVSNTVVLTVSSATPSISITASQTAICSGTIVTFTATAINGGTTPVYQWRKNGNAVGTNNAVYTDNALANGDIVSCELTSNANCATTTTANSNSITMLVTPIVTPTISISTPATNICAGSSVTFTSVITGGGTTPIYQWRKNGINVGSNTPNYTDNNLANTDVITCVLQSNAACASTANITSNAITMVVNNVSVPSISIAATATSICAGNSVTFTATATNAGTSPVYQWRKNGNIVGGNSATYVDNLLANGTTITCTLISNAACSTPATIVSNTITMSVLSLVTPSITISGPTSTCAGSTVTYTASVLNGGTAPVYQWRVNGINVGASSNTFSTSTLTSGSIVSCVLLSNRSCVTNTTANSNNITVTVNNVTTPSVSLTTNTTSICSGTNTTFTATPVNGGTSRSYSWYVNGSFVSTTSANTFSTNTLTNGSSVYCVMNVLTGTCLTTNIATSNTINITVNTTVVPTVTITTPLTTVIVGSTVTFTAIPTNTGTVTNYQWRVNSINVGTNSATYTTTTLANNDVVTCTVSGNAPCASPTSANSNAITMTVISNYLVRGRIVNPNNLPIPGVKVKVNTTDSMVTTSNGVYNFNLPVAGNFTITPSKNNDIVKASGVNVLDVLLTQRHISNATPITSPYRLLAADVNNSATISIVDVLLMRRLILGVDTTFAGNRLWGFVDSSYVFPNPTNPFPASNTSIQLNNLSSALNNQTFIGFKLGDVNMDLTPTVGVNRVARTATPLILYYDTVVTNNQNVVVLKIKARNFKQLLGTQFTLHFNNKVFSYAGIQHMHIPFDYNSVQADKTGNISFIWTDETASAKTLADGTVLFELWLNKTGAISKEDIDINSSITEAMACNASWKVGDVLKGEGVMVENKAALYTHEFFTVAPNPTKGNITVRIIAKANKKATLNIYSANGKIVLQKVIDLIEGVNEFKLNLHQNVRLDQGTYMATIIGLDTQESKPIILIR